jgi:hypothetical protein
MTCIPIKNGVVCCHDDFVNLAPYGAKVWMSWHNYLGPVFYRSKNAIKQIDVPSQKTWDAFGKWHKQRRGRDEILQTL